MSHFYTPWKRQKTFDTGLKWVKEETAWLLREGIIEPAVFLGQVQVFVTSNENHILDYSDTINIFTEDDAYSVPNIVSEINCHCN